MQKILVTGANGQLGTCIKKLTNVPYQLVFKNTAELDITNYSQIAEVFRREKFHFCINGAAYTAVDKAEKEPSIAFNINQIGVRNLAEICLQYKVTLLHISTDFVFDGEVKKPYTELCKTNPINTYGCSKLAGEQEIIRLMKQYYIIRTSWLYSEFGHNFMKTMLKLGAKDGEIKVVNDQYGTPTSANDLAEALLKIIIYKIPYGLYHFSNTGITSWYKFSKEIFRITGKSVNLIAVASENHTTLAKRPKYSAMDIQKIQNVLPIAYPDWKKSLQKTLKKMLLF